jgi:hypothetical protein
MASNNQEIQFDAAKFKELVVYICSQAQPENLGAVKFHKVLYYADMIYYVMSGHPITGATYRRRPLGPTADQLLRYQRELVNEGALSVSNVNYFGFVKKQYEPKRVPDIARFNAEEIKLVDEVIHFVCNESTAKAISELSHNLAWESTPPGGTIPYYSAFLMFPNQVSESAFEWAEREGPAIEAEKQKRSPVDYPVLADFRSRLLQEPKSAP